MSAPCLRTSGFAPSPWGEGWGWGRTERFLAEMGLIVWFARMEAAIEPIYLKGDRGTFPEWTDPPVADGSFAAVVWRD